MKIIHFVFFFTILYLLFCRDIVYVFIRQTEHNNIITFFLLHFPEKSFLVEMSYIMVLDENIIGCPDMIYSADAADVSA